tara:strand:- start:39 stop:593 length:555 start_codon:yes stop_codon:yes gene_type:complete
VADLSRRDFIASTGIGLTCWVSGVSLLLSPEQARAASIPLDALSDSQATTLGALGNALVPGARTAGLVQYVDKQLGVDNTLLILKYLGVDNTDMTGFYRAALDSAYGHSLSLFKTTPVKLTADQAHLWAGSIAAGADSDWRGPPAGFFFFVVRADACDVLFGNRRGSEDIGVPYMAHIEPVSPW